MDRLKARYRRLLRYSYRLKEGGKAWEKVMKELEEIKKQIEINERYAER